MGGGENLLFPQEEQGERRQRKRTLIVKVLRSASEPAPGAAAPVQLPAAQPRAGLRAKEQDEFYEPYLLLGPKAKKKEEGRVKKSTILLLFDYRTLQRS